MTKEEALALWRKRNALNEILARLDYVQRDAERSGDEEMVRMVRPWKLEVLSRRNALDALCFPVDAKPKE